MGKRIFVTGGTGLVGGEVVRHFLEAEWFVTMATSRSGLLSQHPRLTIVPFNLEQSVSGSISESLEECQAVVHCGAVMAHTAEAGDPCHAQRMVGANAGGTFGLLQMAAGLQVPQAITIGRTAGFSEPDGEVSEQSPPKPLDPYGLSKQLSEHVADYFNARGLLRTATLRISAPYGYGSRIRSVIPVYIERALTGKNLELWGTGARSQTFTYVRDIARACELAILKQVSGPFNIAGSRPVSMLELAETVLLGVEDSGSRIVFTGKEDPGEDVRSRISIEKARSILGFDPAFDLSAGIAATLAEIRGGRTALWSTGPIANGRVLA